MAKINSKNKGNDYELKIAKVLGLWWNEEFHRTPASGGLKWKQDNRVSGDIVPPPDSIFPFNIECKKREGWCLEQVLKGKGEVEEWWDQCYGDANSMDKKPLLVFSKNFDSDYAMMLLEDFMGAINGLERFPINYFIVVKPGKPPRVIFVLTEFIKYVPKPHIVQRYSL